MEGCGLVLLLIVIGAALVAAGKSKERNAAHTNYHAALTRLKSDPANPNLREMTLRLGRIYSSHTRNYRGVTLFDEVALMNDINAACAAAAQSRNVTAAPSQSIEQRLERLADLKAKGLIDETEYAERRRQILGEL